ncbi:MAG TPA: Gfo/Idh/MocA family oxidoreductase [Blastocatellia bacterium]|nr:Gfo/Idh/MocA family oxidoreductase [Blastocatellia bacterium]
MNRRRDFIKSSVAVSAAAATLGFNIKASAGSPNDTIRVAVVGLRGQGNAHLGAYSRMPNVEVAALCDVDESILTQRCQAIEKGTGRKPKEYVDIRKLLEDKSIDAVSIATPNHWHSLMGIWACQAGKDVYLEKPCSHTYWEGKQLVAAARKYNRIVQHGTNSRSSVALREAMQKLQEGVIGEVYMARGLCYKWRDTIGRKPDEPVPAGVHYDLWLGPAPQRPFNPNRFHYNWHWNWDYGNGDIGNQGIHEMDICRWGLGVTLPTKVCSMGGHFMFDDDQVTPNTQISTLEFTRNGKKKIIVFEVRHWMTNNEAGIGQRPGADGLVNDSNCIGNVFYGSEGYMSIDGYTSYRTFLGKKQEPGPSRREGGSNWQNFIDALRNRKQGGLNAEIEEGHLSSALVHLSNISYRLGRSLTFDPVKEQVQKDSEATAMLRRQYRQPFVVPEKV